jgi:hypothetical protein
MGASQSVDVATEAQKARTGPFYLRSTEKQALNALDLIVNKLLTENNLFDLQEILSTDGCKKLFVVVSSTVKDEFQVLKFPDPRHPSETTSLSFIHRKRYDTPKVAESDTRVAACGAITQFLIRLVTLTCAATASISTSPGEKMSRMLAVEAPVSAEGAASAIRALKEAGKFTQPPVDAEVVKLLIDEKGVRIVDEKRPNLIAFGSERTYVIDKDAGVIYNALREATPVFSIRMVRKTGLMPVDVTAAAGAAAAAPRVPQMFAFGAPAAPAAPALQPAPGTNVGSTVTYAPTGTVTTGIPGTRRRRGARRRTRRAQRGGADAVFIEITVTELPIGGTSCAGISCTTVTFYSDLKGNTFNKSEFDNFQTSVARGTAPGSIPISVPFGTRMEQIFTSNSFRTAPTVLPTYQVEYNRDRYRPLAGASEETYKTFTRVKDDMKELETGSAPAPYRAFLLASREDPSSVYNLFCSDKWANQYATGILAYSMLQALYNDGADGKPSNRNAEACRLAVKEFIGAGALQDASASGAVPETFDNVKFPSYAEALSAYCRAPGGGPRSTSRPDDKNILKNAHRALRDLYDTHIAKVVGIMKKVLTLRQSKVDSTDVRLALNDAFVTDERGALPVLEAIIVEMREIIRAHFLAVEKTYVGALQALIGSRRGFLPNNTLSTSGSKQINVLSAVSASLE